MKKLLASLLILGTVYTSSAQKRQLSIKLSKPFTIGQSYVSEHFNGIIDFGIDYSFLSQKKWQAGIASNFGYYKGDIINQPIFIFDDKALNMGAQFFFRYTLGKFRPSLAMGYGYQRINTVTILNSGTSIYGNINQGGLLLSVATDFQIYKKFFLSVQYDYSKYSPGNGYREYSSGVKSGNSLSMDAIKVGVGYRF